MAVNKIQAWDGTVVATIVDLAQHVVIDTAAGRMTVDGEGFPWAIAEDSITVNIDPESIPTVTFTILAEAVTVLPRKGSTGTAPWVNYGNRGTPAASD